MACSCRQAATKGVWQRVMQTEMLLAGQRGEQGASSRVNPAEAAVLSTPTPQHLLSNTAIKISNMKRFLTFTRWKLSIVVGMPRPWQGTPALTLLIRDPWVHPLMGTSLVTYLNPEDQNTRKKLLWAQFSFLPLKRKDLWHHCPPVKSKSWSLDVTFFQAVSLPSVSVL